MRRFQSLLLAVAFALTPGALAQDETPSVEASEITSELAETPVSELAVRLAPLTRSTIEEISTDSQAQLGVVANELAAAIIEQQRARDAGPQDGMAAIDDKVTDLMQRKSDLVARNKIVLDALEAKGGDVAEARAYLAVVRNLAPASMQAQEPAAEETKEADLAAQTATAIATVREEPPAHERAQPWEVDLAELRLALQPLRRKELDERVQEWLLILQREVRERIRIDIALERATEQALQQDLANRQSAQQLIITDLVKRVEVGIVMLEKRGGDVSEYKRYIRYATGQKVSRDPQVFMAQAMAWLRSPDGGMAILLSIGQFLGILALAWIVSRVLGKAVRTAVKRVPKASSLLQDFAVGSVTRLTLLIGVVIGISFLGVNITPLIAAIGAAGLVIGLALQGTLSNFASGILILVYRPYDVGDVISAGGVTGKVEAMNLVSTTVLTFDNQVMLVPNNQIWNGVITNITGRNTRRVDLIFGIGYDDDIEKAMTIIDQTLRAHKLTLNDPAPIVRVHELGDNSVNLIARPWTKTSDYWDLYWDLMRQVKERFDAEGINIPYPQRDLHVPGPIEIKWAGDGPSASSSVEAKEQLVRSGEPGPGEDEDD